MLPGEEHARFKKYNPLIHTWSKVPVGHIVTLKAGDHILLKGYNVDSCRDFDRLLSDEDWKSYVLRSRLPLTIGIVLRQLRRYIYLTCNHG